MSKIVKLPKKFLIKNKRAIYGGVIASVFTGLAYFLIGSISGYEAKQLMSTSLSGINMLCNTIILGSTTILALLLTLLGINSGLDVKFNKAFYDQVSDIAKFDTILLIGALILFQLFNIPITKTDTLPTSWFETIYWSSLIISSLLSGMMIIVILMLHATVINMIKIIGLNRDSKYLSDEE